MATPDDQDIRVMVIGEEGAGKSTIANKLFDFHAMNDEEQFPERGVSAAVTATVCRYLREDKCTFSEEPNPTLRRVHVVEVLGFLGQDVTSTRNNWNDIIKAFYFLEMKVNVFLLVLNVNNPQNSETVTRALVDFFGAEAGLNTMVLFSHNEKPDEGMANRFAMFHHGNYLKQLLGDDVPYQVLPIFNKGEFPRLEILRQISLFKSNLSAYDQPVFKKAHMEYLQKWAQEMRSHGQQIIKTMKRGENRFEINGVPDELLIFDKYYTEPELNKIFR